MFTEQMLGEDGMVFFLWLKGGENMKKRQLKKAEMTKIVQEFQEKQRTVVSYAASNSFELVEFMEELAKVYHLDDHVDLTEMLAEEGEKNFVENIFTTLWHHANWDEEHALEDALVHAQMGILKKRGELTHEKERELRLKCYECATYACCGTKVD